ncbi:HAD-IA family hydrolase [Cerasicoccus frondis]|uniref:HAD-IA family hydrolase n=1 Tax=Cerasicoccus frondis TaxID=490090 RepID=UPI0028525AB6|nr:HAD-IA family hydrolase [Cerasicoccus frondis]
MNLEGIQAITFDAAGTLIEPYPSVGEVYAEELAKLGYPLSADLLNDRFRTSFKAQKSSKPEVVLDRDSWRAIVAGTLAGLTPTDTFDAQFDALWNAFAQPERWRLLPGVESTLAQLHAHGQRLFVLSNNDSRLRGIIDGLGIGQYFEAIFISAELGAEKPSPRIFELVREAIGVDASELLHVGDSPVEDIQGALDAGWWAALVGPKAGLPHSVDSASATTIADLFAT